MDDVGARGGRRPGGTGAPRCGGCGEGGGSEAAGGGAETDADGDGRETAGAAGGAEHPATAARARPRRGGRRTALTQYDDHSDSSVAL